jgi:hypothetical protein
MAELNCAGFAGSEFDTKKFDQVNNCPTGYEAADGSGSS